MEASKYVQHEDYKALLLRRKFTELSKADGLMDRAHKWYPSLGGKWSGEKRRWTFPSGAVIEFGHMEYESNKHDYQSAAYAFVGFDEVTSFTESMYLYLISRVRSMNPKIPKILRAATNPGNIGHAWVKKRFITGKKPYTIYEDKDGMSKCFIPATAYDNPTGMKNDPNYVKRLELLPDKEKRMLLYGDWDVFEGQFFADWEDRIHVCKPFNLGNAYRFMAMDYGYSSPSSVGWFAVTENGMTYLERELYIEKQTYSELAKMILDMTPKNEQIFYCVADPKIWGDRPHHKDSMVGESGGEVMAKIFGNRITLIKGDNNRITGWGRCREYLKPYKVNGEVTARFKVFNTCPNFIRTVPQQIHNETGNVEDLDCYVKGTLISTPTGEKRVENIKIGDLVNTPIGNKRVIKAGLSGKSDYVCSVYLSDGRILRGTANHKVGVWDRGLIELQNLKTNDILMEKTNILLLWQLRKLFIKVSFIVNRMVVSIIDQMEHILRRGIKSFIGKFMLTIMGKFQRDTIFTIKTIIAIIIPQKILSQCLVFPTVNIMDILQNQNLKEIDIVGNGQKKEKEYYKKMPIKCLKIPQCEDLNVEIVELLLKLNIKHNFIAKIVRNLKVSIKLFVPFVVSDFYKRKMVKEQHKLVHINAVGNYGREKVYRLTIEDAHLYYANGILSTNTTGEDHLADMWRYGMMSRPGVPDMVKETRILTRDERLWKLARDTLKRQKKGNDMLYIGGEG